MFVWQHLLLKIPQRELQAAYSQLCSGVPLTLDTRLFIVSVAVWVRSVPKARGQHGTEGYLQAPSCLLGHPHLCARYRHLSHWHH